MNLIMMKKPAPPKRHKSMEAKLADALSRLFEEELSEYSAVQDKQNAENRCFLIAAER